MLGIRPLKEIKTNRDFLVNITIQVFQEKQAIYRSIKRCITRAGRVIVARIKAYKRDFLLDNQKNRIFNNKA